jgi:hypothetical protein
MQNTLKSTYKIFYIITAIFFIFLASSLTNLSKNVFAQGTCSCSQDPINYGVCLKNNNCVTGYSPVCSSWPACSPCTCVGGGGGGIQIGPTFGSPWGIGSKGLGYFVSVILSNAVAIAGVLLLFLLIFGGISIMMGAGSGNKDDVAKGKKAVTAAIAGFLIIFCAYWIIRIVEIITGFDIFNPGI